jgi:hypothetical protein
MPIKKIKYTCKYRCGEKATDYKSMIEHEKICYLNESQRACRLCKNLDVDTDVCITYLTCKISNYYYDCLDCITYDKNHKEIWRKGDCFLKERPFPRRGCKDFISSDKKRF